MEHLNSVEWYLWRKHSDKKYPWERNNLNTDFLKSERKRINDINSWMKNFQRIPFRASLEEVCYYVVPVKIKPSWLTYLEAGNYLCKGLSALRNCPIYPLVAFFPSGKIPTDYSLIRINSSKKIALLNNYTKSTTGEYAMIVEDWEELDSSEIYVVDMPFEEGIISKILRESTNIEKSLAESIGAPLISSPFILGDVGGISLASILDDADSSQGLNIALQMMLPPEYRSFSPPKSGIRGRDMEIRDGISIHVAEKIITGRNYVSSVEGSSFSVMDPEKRKRADFREDLWLQIVSLRQKTPLLSISQQEEENYRSKIKKDIDVVLCEKMPEAFRDIVAEIKVKDCMENLNREAKSLARAEGKEKVDLSLLHHARNDFLDRFWQLEEDEMFRSKRIRRIYWHRNQQLCRISSIDKSIISSSEGYRKAV